MVLATGDLPIRLKKLRVKTWNYFSILRNFFSTYEKPNLRLDQAIFLAKTTQGNPVPLIAKKKGKSLPLRVGFPISTKHQPIKRTLKISGIPVNEK